MGQEWNPVIIPSPATIDRTNNHFTENYHRLFQKFLEQYGGENGLCQLIAETKEMIAPYVESDPTRFCTYEEFEKGVTA